MCNIYGNYRQNNKWGGTICSIKALRDSRACRPCRAQGRVKTGFPPSRPRARAAPNAATRPVGARRSNPGCVGRARRAAAEERLLAAAAGTRFLRRHPVAGASPTGAAGAAGAGHSVRTGRSRASTDPGSAGRAAADTVAGSTAAGSPRKARAKAAARWSTEPETPSRAGRVSSCGPVRRHGGPSNNTQQKHDY